VHDAPLGPAIIVPLPAGKDSQYSDDGSKIASAPPAPFPEDAAVEFSRHRGIWRLVFPASISVNGVTEPHDYEVTAFHSEDGAERRLFRRYILREKFFHSAAFRSKKVTADFRAELFPKEGSVRFEIRPRDVYGRLGDTLKADFPTKKV
jgi:hypothetical protein